MPDVEDPPAILPRLAGDVLGEEELRCAQEFTRLVPSHATQGDHRQRAVAIADIFDGFYSALTKIVLAVQDQSGGTPCK